MTDNRKTTAWVLYDGDCRLCTATARRFEGALALRSFTLLPLQTPWVGERLGLPQAQLLAEMRVMFADGKFVGGADAVVYLARRIWWLWPLWAVSRIPAAMPLLRRGYRWYAANRYCISGRCDIGTPDRVANTRRLSKLLALLPLLVLPTLALLFARTLEAWVFMWVMAFALYVGCKWLTYCVARNHGVNAGWLRSLGYLLTWPGMDAAAFLRGDNRPLKPRSSEWLSAAIKTLFGVALIWLVVPKAMPLNPLLTGWIGMAGVVFVLHFGAFHFLALCWRSAGVNATPLMNSPLLARSLSEFWGRRWNTAFHELVNRFTFRPISRVTGATRATLIVFLLSGLVHELVISLPARGGYGLPTAYFLIQGLGIVGEHTPLGRRMGLGRGLRGWLFTIVVTAGPAFLLFHPPFVHNVILPMLAAIGAI